tara:strand:- start:4337 stop:4834 length:498 start_codon:yes stop_codon:yes gene_type:complete
MENKIKLLIIIIVILTSGFFTFSYFKNEKINKQNQTLLTLNKNLDDEIHLKRQTLTKLIGDLETSDITKNDFLILLKSINYNLKTINDINEEELNILIRLIKTENKLSLEELTTKLSHDLYISAINQILVTRKKCEEAKEIVKKIKFYNSIKDEADYLALSCKGE